MYVANNMKENKTKGSIKKTKTGIMFFFNTFLKIKRDRLLAEWGIRIGRRIIGREIRKKHDGWGSEIFSTNLDSWIQVSTS